MQELATLFLGMDGPTIALLAVMSVFYLGLPALLLWFVFRTENESDLDTERRG